MLSRILDFSEKSEFILINDTVDCSGFELLSVFLRNSIERYDVTHLFLFEKCQSEIAQVSPTGNLIVHDFSSDPLGWINPQTNSKINSQFSFSKGLKASSDGEIAVVIDSISSLLLHCSLENLCFSIRELGTLTNAKSVTVISLFHYDCWEKDIKWGLEYIADTVLDVGIGKQPKMIGKKAKKLPNRRKICKTRHKKPTGKVLEAVESFSVVHGRVVDVAPWNAGLPDEEDTDSSNVILDEDDPAANLTFNLNLSSEEKQERSKLVMPYTKARHLEVKIEENLSKTSASGDGGFIYYEPDEADDFDDEDPDDDLDF